jgi:hypothetical protein
LELLRFTVEMSDDGGNLRREDPANIPLDLPYLRREMAHIHIARTEQRFLTALPDVLAHPPTTEDRARWRVTAEAHSWQRQVDEIERLLDGFLVWK